MEFEITKTVRQANTPLLSSKLSVVTLGLASFHEALQTQGIDSVHVDWRPPAGGDPKLLAILETLTQR